MGRRVYDMPSLFGNHDFTCYYDMQTKLLAMLYTINFIVRLILIIYAQPHTHSSVVVSPKESFSLRLSAHLLLGIVRVHQKQTHYALSKFTLIITLVSVVKKLALIIILSDVLAYLIVMYVCNCACMSYICSGYE